jgi:hypothetical protein
MRPVNKQRPRGGRPNNGRKPHMGGGGGGGGQRNFDSNGPEVKIRGTAAHIFDRYCQLARDANASGDRIAAENYLQHAEHYYRIMMANGGFQQNQPRHQQQPQQPQPQQAAAPQPLPGTQPQPPAQGIPEFEADMLEAEIEMAQGEQPPQG